MSYRFPEPEIFTFIREIESKSSLEPTKPNILLVQEQIENVPL